MRKVPYMIIVGKKEMESRTLSIRGSDGSEMKGLTPDQFIEKLKEENTYRR
jgi:threonyl-tRNA synthetase